MHVIYHGIVAFHENKFGQTQWTREQDESRNIMKAIVLSNEELIHARDTAIVGKGHQYQNCIHNPSYPTNNDYSIQMSSFVLTRQVQGVADALFKKK